MGNKRESALDNFKLELKNTLGKKKKIKKKGLLKSVAVKAKIRGDQRKDRMDVYAVMHVIL